MNRLALLLLLAFQEPVGDIDAFMERVLEQRDINWEQYHNYFCKERAELVIEGSMPGVPIQGFTKEYLWFIRDGYVVRSPLSVDGVAVSAEERAREEAKWVERMKKREKEREPDRETFFGLQFEPGNYFYAGRREHEGREVVVVEYYPEAWFDAENDEDEHEYAEKLNKTFVSTMLIDPEEHQIVRMTIDNVGFDFLPAGWLVKLDTIEASLSMHKPIENIWLARDVEAFGAITTAGGNLSIRYHSEFYDYARAETGATYRFPPRGLEKPESKR